MAPPHILLLGGHGKISLFLTPLLLARSWSLTSLVRSPSQKPAILAAGKNQPGTLNVLVESLVDVKSEIDAQRILDLVKPDWVVWSAGAGGKGGPDMTYAIDRDACISFIRASVATPSITKFLLVSALSIRRSMASWFSDAAYAEVQKVNTEMMPHYYKAKLAADEAMTVLGEERRQRDNKWQYVVLRPGMLTDEEPSGKVALGRTDARGKVSRADVADVAARLLEVEGANGWFDLLNGEEDTTEAVQRVVKEGVNSMEGEDVKVMKANLA